MRGITSVPAQRPAASACWWSTNIAARLVTSAPASFPINTSRSRKDKPARAISPSARPRLIERQTHGLDDAAHRDHWSGHLLPVGRHSDPRVPLDLPQNAARAQAIERSRGAGRMTGLDYAIVAVFLAVI